jgi:hypothetical protein
MPSRHHLTIAEKNRLRRHHREHPELTQEQLREWAYASFGQWVARSTVGHIVRAPEERSANPQATRFQSGRYPDMEQELYALLLARATQMGVDLTRPHEGRSAVMSDAELWTKANEILKRTRGSDESVSAAWVHRFKRRHGLHRSQWKRAAATAVSSRVGGGSGVEAVATTEGALQVAAEVGGSAVDAAVVEQEEEMQPPPRKRPATAAGPANAVATATRSHFVSADDVLLLKHVLAVKPWTFPYAMDGWQQVVARLRVEPAFRLEKSAGAYQARLNLLLSHMSAGNVAALRKSGTQEEFDRKCALIREVSALMEAHGVAERGNTVSSAVDVAPVVPTTVLEGAAVSPALPLPDLVREREQMAQRRLELMERKMERELAAQKRHSEEQVRRLETLHHEQQQIQQEQHSQLLATIQQQQAMMLELIKSLTPATNQV